jgi:hypothetical protein
MPRFVGNPLNLGIVAGAGIPLTMTPEMRSMHLYTCGTTGTGKSKMLESLVRQDIINWHKTKCGALILDPHGSLYNSLMSWVTWNQKYLKDVPLDLRQKDWTIGYNVRRGAGRLSVQAISEQFSRVLARVTQKRVTALSLPNTA